jgi:hypothetical protein
MEMFTNEHGGETPQILYHHYVKLILNQALENRLGLGLGVWLDAVLTVGA